MSRIGKKPIALPAKVDITIDGQAVTVKGPKGELSHRVHPEISIKQEDGAVVVERPSDEKRHRALHGLTRALVANMVTGVSDGFRKTLFTEGVGYTAEVRGNDLVMKMGFSHDVVMSPPEGIKFAAERGSGNRYIIHVDGIDKQIVGQVAANIREVRPPEPYKGKGIRYADETIRRKAGKAGKAK
jgi:large subunit ribosomal protein L6